MIINNPDKEVVNKGLDSIWYVKLYTENSQNINSLSSDAQYERSSQTPVDYNDDGDIDDSPGGHIIDPAQLVVTYESKSGDTLREPRYLVGDGLSTYFAAENTDNNLESYWKISEQATVSPEVIDGYKLPAVQSVVLGRGFNELRYVYEPRVSNQSASESDHQAGKASSLAETGVSVSSLMHLAVGLLFGGGLLLAVNRRVIRIGR